MESKPSIVVKGNGEVARGENQPRSVRSAEGGDRVGMVPKEQESLLFGIPSEGAIATF